MRYTYTLKDSRDQVLESGFASEEEAYIYVQTLGITDYVIEREQHYTVTGMGRDPDLH